MRFRPLPEVGGMDRLALKKGGLQTLLSYEPKKILDMIHMTVYNQQTIRSGYCKPTPQERVHDRMFYRLVSHRLWEQHALPVWMLLLDVLLRSAQDNAWMKLPDPYRNH